MLRPRSALIVLAVALLAWVVGAHVSTGGDTPRTQIRLGLQLVDVGLASFGSILIGQATGTYAHRAEGGDAAAAQKQAECELALADIFREKGNWRRARYYYNRVKAATPEAKITARCWLAYLDWASGVPGMRAELLRMYEEHGDNPLPAYLAGKSFLDDDESDKARTYLEQGLSRPGGDTYDTRAALAQACRLLSDTEAAGEHARKAMRLAETPSQQWAAAGLLDDLGLQHPPALGLWAKGMWQRHRSRVLWLAVLMAVLLYPTWLALLSRVVPSLAARLYIVAGSADPSAIASYEAALKQAPDDTALLKALAHAYHRVGGGARRSAELYQHVLQLSPDDTEALNQTVALALESGSETEVAIAACQGWFGANPGHPDAQAVALHLGRAYRKLGRHVPAQALPPLRMAADAAPSDRELQNYVAVLYRHYGYGAEAATLFARVAEAEPNDPNARLELARALIAAGEGYAAYRHLRALPPSPESTTDLYLAGVVAQEAGRRRESARIFQEVVRRDANLFDTEERLSESVGWARTDTYGGYTAHETEAAHEAFVLHRADHPERGPVLLLAFRRDVSDAVEFPAAFQEDVGRARELSAGVAPIVDVGVDEELYYVVYEPPPGQKLSAMLERMGTISPWDAARIVVSVCHALDEVHEAGGIHGDVRPTAIWIDEANEVTLVGAGMTSIADAGRDGGPPATRSAHHVAPELVQGQPATPASDVYSVGCVLHELLTGAPPIDGPTHLATMMAHVTVQAEPPSMKAPMVPEALDTIVEYCLAKEPSRRYSTASELLEALHEVMVDAGEAGGEEEEEAAPPAQAAPAETSPVGADGMPMLEGVGVPPHAGLDDHAASDPNCWWTFYRDTALIATARYAKVYRGVHRATSELHAIKHLQTPATSSVADDPRGMRAVEAMARLFGTEMHILQLLSEQDPPVPGIVTMCQAYRAPGGSPAYAMPLLSETLGERASREGALAEEDAIKIVTRLAEALDALHERGIAHRNVSPRSVMFGGDGLPYLGGFDRACRLAEAGPMLLAEAELQMIGRSPADVLGDVHFLSPETCRGDQFDHRTDIYSLGCLLYYLLTGAPPFDEPDPMQVMLDHVGKPAPSLQERGVSASTNTQEGIYRALAKSPSERYESTGAMARALGSSPGSGG